MNDYVTLTTSDGLISLKFSLLEFKPGRPRSEARETLSSGRTHVTRGRRQRGWEVTFLAAETEGEVGWGSLGDLEQLHGYDLPGATPSDELTLALMDESEYQVKWLGGFEPVPQGVVLYGTTAYYAVKAELLDVTRPRCDFSVEHYSMYLAAV